jgi:cell wall assembly regulator SMI1
MKNILQQFEQQIAAMDGALEELNPPATAAELDAAERALGVKLPDDVRQFYQWRNGDQGNQFLFGEFRIMPLSELLESNQASRKSMNPEWLTVTDASGVFKDCIANPKWIQFGDNGGNTILFLDMDPGQQGTPGQLLESCDGEPDCRYRGIREWMTDLTSKIEKGELAWDDEAGSYMETDETSVAELASLKNRTNVVNDAPNLAALSLLRPGDEVTLVGAIEPNPKTNKHQLYIRGGSVTVVGAIGKISAGLVGGPPLVKVKVRAGKKSLFGMGAPTLEVISCERVAQ